MPDSAVGTGVTFDGFSLPEVFTPQLERERLKINNSMITKRKFGVGKNMREGAFSRVFIKEDCIASDYLHSIRKRNFLRLIVSILVFFHGLGSNGE